MLPLIPEELKAQVPPTWCSWGPTEMCTFKSLPPHTHWRMGCPKRLYLCGVPFLRFQSPLLLNLVLKERQLRVQQSQTQGQCPELLIHVASGCRSAFKPSKMHSSVVSLQWPCPSWPLICSQVWLTDRWTPSNVIQTLLGMPLNGFCPVPFPSHQWGADFELN